MKPHALTCRVLFLPACGGAESSGPTDATVADGDAGDTADATPSCGDASCERGEVSLDAACPDCGAGSVCVHKPAVKYDSTYCVTIPSSCCGGIPMCECMGECACAPIYYRGCVAAYPSGIECDGPLS